jgi:hypothetical protein
MKIREGRHVVAAENRGVVETVGGVRWSAGGGD